MDELAELHAQHAAAQVGVAPEAEVVTEAQAVDAVDFDVRKETLQSLIRGLEAQGAAGELADPTLREQRQALRQELMDLPSTRHQALNSDTHVLDEIRAKEFAQEKERQRQELSATRATTKTPWPSNTNSHQEAATSEPRRRQPTRGASHKGPSITSVLEVAWCC